MAVDFVPASVGGRLSTWGVGWLPASPFDLNRTGRQLPFQSSQFSPAGPRASARGRWRAHPTSWCG